MDEDDRASLIIGRVLPFSGPDRALGPVDVVRHPHDLEVHLARLRDSVDVAQVYGALVDLFIQTAPHQHELRRATLDRYASALARDEHDALAAALEQGLEATSPIPPAPWSTYTVGITNPTPLVVARRVEADPSPVAAAPETTPTPTPRVLAPASTPTRAPAPAPAPAPDRSPFGDRRLLALLVGLVLVGWWARRRQLGRR